MIKLRFGPCLHDAKSHTFSEFEVLEVFPGDHKFSRCIQMNTNQSELITLELKLPEIDESR